MNIAGQDEQATELKPIFSDCIQEDLVKLEPFTLLMNGLIQIKLKQIWKKLINDSEKKLMVLEVSLQILSSTTGQFSQIMEQLKEISRNPQLDFGDDYAYRKIIIFSDLMQHSKQLSLISKCRDKKKCDFL